MDSGHLSQTFYLTATHLGLGAFCTAAINDADIERILDAASVAGVKGAGYVLLRLPIEVRDLFVEWLKENYPDRAAHVMKLVRDMRGGKDYDSTFGARMTGAGPIAWMIGRRFEAACERLGLNRRKLKLSTEHFTPTWTITIVDNASTDGTWQVVEQLDRTLDGVQGLHLDQPGHGEAPHDGPARGDPPQDHERGHRHRPRGAAHARQAGDREPHRHHVGRLGPDAPRLHLAEVDPGSREASLTRRAQDEQVVNRVRESFRFGDCSIDIDA